MATNRDITRLETGPRMSQAVIHNGLVYLAGQVGTPGDGVYAQTKTCLAEVDRLLALAGTDKTRILAAQVWLSDAGMVAEMNRAWEDWAAPGHTPARATGESRLVAPEYLVEVIVTAALP
jgi:enamine deaminase RidA (YjgF/YER057c/UK114 family)